MVRSWLCVPCTSCQIHDFAQLSENTYHVYHNTEDLRGEPHTVAIRAEDDMHVTEEVYKRPLFLQPGYRCRIASLPCTPAPPPLRSRGLPDGLLPHLAGTTACPCRSTGPLWKPSWMPSSVSSG